MDSPAGFPQGSLRLAFTTKEAAEALGVSPRTMEGWRVSGGGPRFVKLSRGVVRYRPSDLTEFLETQAVANTAQYSAMP